MFMRLCVWVQFAGALSGLFFMLVHAWKILLVRFVLLRYVGSCKKRFCTAVHVNTSASRPSSVIHLLVATWAACITEISHRLFVVCKAGVTWQLAFSTAIATPP